MSSCKYIELHLHLDGAVRVSTLYKISQKKYNTDISINEFAKLVSIGNKKCFDSLTECLSTFEHILSLIAGNKQYLEQIAYEICEDQYNNDVLYTEIRYNPHILMGDILSLDEVIVSINNGIKRAILKYPIFVNTILCCMRSKPQWSFDIAKLCIKYRNQGVVGMDIAGDEKNYSDYNHRNAFKLAHNNNINITAHAGEAADEAGGSENIKSAINHLHATRIGHGYACCYDNYLMGYLKRKNIHLECCITSSIQTKSVENINNHPIKIFNKKNLNYSINTDDPSIFNTTYKQEIDLVKEKLELNNNQIHKIMENSLASSFASRKEKVKIKNQLNHNWLNYSINIDDSSIFNTTYKQEIDLVFCFSKREGKNQKLQN